MTHIGQNLSDCPNLPSLHISFQKQGVAKKITQFFMSHCSRTIFQPLQASVGTSLQISVNSLQVTHPFLRKIVSKNCHLRILRHGEADLPRPDQKKKKKKKKLPNPQPSRWRLISHTSAKKPCQKWARSWLQPDTGNYRLLRCKSKCEAFLCKIPSLDVPLHVKSDS